MAAVSPWYLRRPALLGGLVLVVAGVLAGVLWLLLSGDDANSEPVVEGEYVEGLAGSWHRLNPVYATTNEVDQDLARLIFNGLVRIAPDGAVEPDLAAALPDVSADGTTYSFTLRAGITWSDGAPLTSHDVSFTIAAVQDTAFKGDSALAEAWDGVTIETPDDLTVVIRLPQASAPFLARHATLGVLPEHLLRGLDAAALFDAPFNSAPVGTGPYRLQSLTSSEAVLVPNDRYAGNRPNIERVRFRLYADYPAAIAAMLAGDLDGLMVRDTPTEKEIADLQSLPNVHAQAFQRDAYVVLYLNNDQAAYFAEPEVRRALSLAIDRRGLVDRILDGSARPSSSPIAPGSWAYSPDYDVTAPDLSAARRLLSEAGWEVSASTSVLTRGGTEFRFTIRTDNDPVRVAIANEVARQLEPLGIRATVASTTFSVLRRDFLQERRYDAAVAGWDQGPDPDPYFGWHSSQQGSAGLNIANFSDVVMDELIARARTTTDLDVRRDLYRQVQEKWEELAPGVVLVYPDYLYVQRDSVKGVRKGVLATPDQRFYGIEEWTD